MEAISLWRASSPHAKDQVRIIPVAGKTGSTVFVEREKIDQVIINLLDNAAQHSAADSLIRVKLMPPSGLATGFQIIDEGQGVCEEDLPRLFEPFFTRRRHGVGLGLSIVRHIIESHNGRVSIRRNCPHPGVTVDVSLPLFRP